jgi:hypothetical protein
LFATPIVKAPRRFASLRQETVKGVVPLAATAMTTSSAPILVLLGKAVSLIDRVLGPFDRTQQRVPASSNEQQQALLGPTESRNELRPVLDGESAGGAGADIDEAAGPAQSLRGGRAASRSAKRAALTAATAVNWPSISASAMSKGAHASISEYRGLARSVSMIHAEC